MPERTVYALGRIPRGTRWGIGLLFLGYLCLRVWGDGNLGHFVLNSDQTNYMVFYLKSTFPHLFGRDPVFADATMMAHYMPMFLGLLKGVFGAFAYLPGLRLLQILLCSAYLLGFFALFHGLSGRPWVSAFITLLTCETIAIFPIETWGAGSVHTVLARTFFLIFLPLFYWGWWRFRQSPRQLVAVYGLMGLVGNLHPVSFATLIPPLLLAQCWMGRGRWQVWRLALLCGGAALLPMVPFLAHYLSHTQEGQALSPGDFALAFSGVSALFPFLDPARLWNGPITVQMSAGWYLVGAWALWQTRRETDLGLLPFTAACVGVFGLYYGVTAWILLPNQILPTLIDLTRVLKFLMLPIGIATCVWLSRYQGKALWLWGLGVLYLTTFTNGELIRQYFATHPLTPSNLAVAQRQQVDYFLLSRGYVLNPQVQAMVMFYDTLAETGRWIQANTDEAQTLLHASLPEKDWIPNNLLRAYSQRSLTFAMKDGGIVYQADKKAFVGWVREKNTLSQWREAMGLCSLPEIQWATQQRQATHLVCFSEAPVPQQLGLRTVHRNAFVSVYVLPQAGAASAEPPLN